MDATEHSVDSRSTTASTELRANRPTEDSFDAGISRRQLRARLFGSPYEQVGPFELGPRVGFGGMGTVFAATDTRLDRRVALKFVHARGERGLEVGLREAKALARVAHPNVVAIHDVGVHEGRLWLAMEYVAGCTLRTWQSEEARSFDAVLALWLAVGRGLAAIHEQGLVHRDLKPSNVVVGDGGRPRIIDFGLVREGSEPKDAFAPTCGESQTSPSGFVGTWAYAAPEQRAGFEALVDARADQYAYCVCVWEALTGERPQRDESGVLFGQGGRSLPRRLRRALRRGLAVNPSERHASMVELLAELERREPAARVTRPAVALATALSLVLGVGSVAALELASDAGAQPVEELSCGAADESEHEPSSAEGVELTAAAVESRGSRRRSGRPCHASPADLRPSCS